MLNFRSYQMSAKELIRYCELALIENYDALNLEVIRILQKRDEPVISERLFKLCSGGTDATAKSALKALGCINTAKSRKCLQRLTKTLPDSQKKNFANLHYEERQVSDLKFAFAGFVPPKIARRPSEFFNDAQYFRRNNSIQKITN